MNREIKFRAWGEDNMWHSYKGGDFCNDIKLGTGGDFGIETGLLDDDFILMQYTGLKDKNGTPVFEGDLLGSNFENLLGVVFREGAFVLAYDCGDAETFYDADFSDYEVIGNIYEDSNLLDKA